LPVRLRVASLPCSEANEDEQFLAYLPLGSGCHRRRKLIARSPLARKRPRKCAGSATDPPRKSGNRLVLTLKVIGKCIHVSFVAK